MRRSRAAIGAACALSVLLSDTQSLSGQIEPDAEGFVVAQPEDLRPPDGERRVTLLGDPSEPGPYVIRVTFLPGQGSRPHYHDQARYITVIEGTWWIATGSRADVYDPDGMERVEAGSFIYQPPNGHHYDMAKDEPVTVQIMGVGPVRTTRIESPPPDQQAGLRIREVMEGLYVLPGFDGSRSGGNVAVRVTDEGVIIVDDKFPTSFDFITEQVALVTDQPIRYVLNTHHHGDHAGSNEAFLRVAEVIAHERARANMVRNGQAGPPRVVFREQTALFLGDAEVRMYHLGRGHTDGDAVVYFPDLRTVHTGDLFVHGQRLDGSTLTPFWDVANGGSLVEWPATLTRLLALDFETVIPGHGRVLGRSDVRDFRTKLEAVIERVRRAIRSGAARESIASFVDIADLEWPLPPVRLRDAFDELSATR